MKTKRNWNHKAGYVSYVMILSLGLVLLSMMMLNYRTSSEAQESAKVIGLRVDYSDKEDEVLRSIVNLLPNRAIRCMQDGSDSSYSARNELRWKTLFSEALDQANARTSVDASLKEEFLLVDAAQATSGDHNYTNILALFDPIEPDPHSWDVSPGTGRDMGPGYPASMDTFVAKVRDNDRIYPIVSRDKIYTDRAQDDLELPVDEYPEFNLIPYPQIRFGYAEPGQPFVAKRNWWAFSLDLAEVHDHITGMDNLERDFVVSLYEVPSQLAISAEAFAVLGKHEDGTDWQNATVEGGVFATRARLEEGFDLTRISGRRGLELPDALVMGELELSGDVFNPGVRERFELDHSAFMPVSLSSESGRAAFLPINRGADFFDRFSHSTETQTLSTTTWNDYSVGALQCVMQLDITDAAAVSDAMPTELTFRYLKQGVLEELQIPLLENASDSALPPGYILCATENETVNFPYPVDLAYGKDGEFYFEEAASGDVTFDNARFGDPLVGIRKDGYYRPSYPFKSVLLQERKWCIEVYPERMEAFLELLGGDDTSVNHSLVVNVDYPASAYLDKPEIPCSELDYGVILKECADLTSFSEGFSLVTNLRLYIADDFNATATTPPVGSGLASPFYPPASLFAPEKRYGAENNPFHLSLQGQMGSLAGDQGGSDGSAVHLLDVKSASEVEMDHDDIEVNLTQIRHPAALPPITMMNWLIVVEERRAPLYLSQSK